MNERIEELARQVDAGYIPRYDMWQMDSETVQKFAELIVRECAQVCVEVVDANSDIYPEFGNGAYFSANRIKEHFGVE